MAHVDQDELRGLVDRWVPAWALCRESTCARVAGGWQVELVGSAHRTREIVLVEPDAGAVEEHAAQLVAASEPTWLSLVTPHPHPWPLPAGTVLQSAAETLMTTDLAQVDADPRVRLDDLWVPGGAAVEAELSLRGRPAAVGSAAVVGRDAVLDRVRTYDAFQRQGLGRAVMTTLTSWAVEQGADTGLLVASEEGRALYAHLGWRPVGAMATLRAAGRTAG